MAAPRTLRRAYPVHLGQAATGSRRRHWDHSVRGLGTQQSPTGRAEREALPWSILRLGPGQGRRLPTVACQRVRAGLVKGRLRAASCRPGCLGPRARAARVQAQPAYRPQHCVFLFRAARLARQEPSRLWRARAQGCRRASEARS